jgi:hypothetical protein
MILAVEETALEEGRVDSKIGCVWKVLGGPVREQYVQT